MAIYEKNKAMPWNLNKIQFVYPPDVFTGTFQNAKMESRNKAKLEQKTKEILINLENTPHPYDAMFILHKDDHVQFLLNNVDLFKKRDCFEKAVLKLYYVNNTSFVIFGDYKVWKFLFHNCDTTSIYNCGQPFLHERITAYRGSATGNRIGLSWTINTKEVEWFLERWQDKDLGGGTIFSLEIGRKDILYHLQDGHRQEVILLPGIAETADVCVIEQL